MVKIGMRKPNLKSSFKARTTGRAKRAVKRAIIPGYGKKGMGWIKNPRKAACNAVYHRTTVGVGDVARAITKPSRGKPASGRALPRLPLRARRRVERRAGRSSSR